MNTNRRREKPGISKSKTDSEMANKEKFSKIDMWFKIVDIH